MEIPKEFFTLQSMLTLTGATGVTYVVANGLQRAFNFNPRWLALVIAEIICLYGVYETGGGGADYVVGAVNGFLVYGTASGVTAITGTAPPTNGVRGFGEGEATGQRGFRTRWF